MSSRSLQKTSHLVMQFTIAVLCKRYLYIEVLQPTRVYFVSTREKKWERGGTRGKKTENGIELHVPVVDDEAIFLVLFLPSIMHQMFSPSAYGDVGNK